MTDRRESCVPNAALIDAAAGHADAETRARVADHLIVCPRCADEFRLLQELAPWADEQAHVIAPAGAPLAHRRSLAVSTPPWAVAAVAILTIASAGLAFEVLQIERTNRALVARVDSAPPTEPAMAGLSRRVAEQQQRIDELTAKIESADAPDFNVPIVDLEAADRRRSATASPPPAIPDGARHVVFVLSTVRPAAGATYEVDVLDSTDRIVWSGSGLRQSSDGTLTLVAPRSFAKGGTRIRLYARRGTARTLVEQYVVPNLR